MSRLGSPIEVKTWPYSMRAASGAPRIAPDDADLAGSRARLGNLDRDAQQHRLERAPRREEFELDDGVPVVDEDRIGLGHLTLPDSLASSALARRDATKSETGYV